MNVTLQGMNTAYRPSVTMPGKRKPQAEKTRGDYDTVKISRPQAMPEDDESFARLLARKAASQLSGGTSQERVQELGRRIADGTYQPDAQRIAGRLLGLG